MPASNFTFVTSISGPTAVPTSPSEELSVSISFSRCNTENPTPPFQTAGAILYVNATISWTIEGQATDVQGFTIGDIQSQSANDPAVEDRLRLGSVNPAGVAFGALSGSGSTYILPLTINPNSAGTIYITVLPNVAFTIPVIGEDSTPTYGPFQPVTASFDYSTLSGTMATTTKPEVDIQVPQDAVFEGTVAPITLEWDSDIVADAGRSIGPNATDDIRITGGTIQADSFEHTDSRMTFNVELIETTAVRSRPILLWNEVISRVQESRITWNNPTIAANNNITISGTFTAPYPPDNEFDASDIQVYINNPPPSSPTGTKSGFSYCSGTGAFSVDITNITAGSGFVVVNMPIGFIPNSPDPETIFISYNTITSPKQINQIINRQYIRIIGKWTTIPSIIQCGSVGLNDITITGGSPIYYRDRRNIISMYLIPDCQMGTITVTVPRHLVSTSSRSGNIQNEENVATVTYNLATDNISLIPSGDSINGVEYGLCTIRVKANSETDTGGDTGPPEDTSESFLYSTVTSPTDDIEESPSGITVIYDSGVQSFTSTNGLLGAGAGAFKGVSDLKLINGYFYGTIQIQNASTISTLNQGTEARAAMFKIRNRPVTGNVRSEDNLSGNNEYNKISEAPRSITEEGENIYFFEGSYPEVGFGNLQSVLKDPNRCNSFDPRSHGIPWRSRLFNPNASSQQDNITYSQHRRMTSPMAVVNDNLYLYAGYGDGVNLTAVRSTKSTNWESNIQIEGRDTVETRIDNWTLLRYGRNLDFRPPVVQTNSRTGYDVIQDLARLCFCYIGFDGDKFIIRPKYLPTADLEAEITTSQTLCTINYTNPNRKFPDSGFIRITGGGISEIFSYTTNNHNESAQTYSFSGIERAQEGTEIGAFAVGAGTTIEYISHIIDMADQKINVRPINELNIRQDLQQLYNIIKINYGDAFLNNFVTSKNTNSVRQNKPRELEFNVDLDHHDTEWVSWLADQYKDFYSEVRYLLELQLQPSFFIKAGDFILLRETQNSLIEDQIFQALRVDHRIKPYTTSLQLRTIS